MASLIAAPTRNSRSAKLAEATDMSVMGSHPLLDNIAIGCSWGCFGSLAPPIIAEMRRIGPPRCARAASGHFTAPPSAAMNLRRPMPNMAFFLGNVASPVQCSTEWIAP